MDHSLLILLIGLAVVAAALVAALSYESRQIMKPPENNPDEFRKRGRTSPGQRVVACLGASIVHGRVSVDFVDLLRRRFPAAGYAFVNAGINGDLVYNALQRLEAVIACDPDAVVILVGTNDVQSTLSESVRRMAMRSKGVPYAPDLAHYRDTLDEIVVRLQRESRALVALCSLPILGEDLASPAIERLREFNAAIRQVAGSPRRGLSAGERAPGGRVGRAGCGARPPFHGQSTPGDRRRRSALPARTEPRRHLTPQRPGPHDRPDAHEQPRRGDHRRRDRGLFEAIRRPALH